MKKTVLILLVVTLSLSVMAQKNTVTGTGVSARTETVPTMADQSELKIFPVPVKENNFTVTSVREIAMIKITNIIGQEVYRAKFPTPVFTTQVFLSNPQRGMYLVTVIFTDDSRVVRKIMVEIM